jgi:hypothetical protein
MKPRSRLSHAVVKSRAVVGAVVLGLGAAGDAQADPGLPASVHVQAFERFIAASGPICQSRPAALCVERAWAQLDADGDDRLSTAELRWVRVTLQDWVLWRGDLRRTESAAIALGLLLSDALGIERLHATFDQDGDGGISRAELLADVRLDQRPLGEILLDPANIDHQGAARRLGLPPALVERLPAMLEPER